MQHPGFFERAGPFTLAEVAAAAECEVIAGGDPSQRVRNITTLSEAGPEELSFLDNRKYLPQLEATKAGACFVLAALAGRVPSATTALVAKAPYRSFAKALVLFYPSSMHPRVARAGTGPIDPTARIEEGAEIQPGAIIGPEAQIGCGTVIASGAVIGYRCTIGRDGFIGPGATVVHALLGDRVILHAGVRIGQDGFGFAMSPRGHLKVPQIGRVIIQDDVEIGANTAIDRGALKDTIIGEGTKIDNLVQIGHNVIIGRHCVIVGQVGIAGSAELGDFVVMGGHAGAVGHIKIGSGAQIAGSSHVIDDVPPGAKMAGTPAVPIRQFVRQLAHMKRVGIGEKGRDDGGGDDA